MPKRISPLLGVGSALFRSAVSVRKAAYAVGLKSAVRLERPVISIGNLTVGGNGKTPFVILVAQMLLERGLNVAVVSRGYGAQTSVAKRTPVLVSEQGQLMSRAEDVGDEPILIAKKCKATVIACGDRVAGAQYAIAIGAQVIVLDDGFQHFRLARDLDIVMVDAKSPFGNGRALPAGSLREPPSALSRADLIVLHHGLDGWKPKRKKPNLFVDTQVVEVGVIPTSVTPLLGGHPRPAAAIAGHPVALIAAIARPERFVETVERLGAKEIVLQRFFRDHAWFDLTSVLEFRHDSADRSADYLLTTEKDAVRFFDGLARLIPELWVLAIDMTIQNGEGELVQKIDGVLERYGLGS